MCPRGLCDGIVHRGAELGVWQEERRHESEGAQQDPECEGGLRSAFASSAGPALDASGAPSRASMIAPIAVTPAVAPIDRKNWVDAVAVPMSLRGTEFWTTTVKFCIRRPTPTPTMITFRVASKAVAEGSMLARR